MGVGHFVSAERRSEFCTAYRAAMRTLPEPSAEHDLDTGFGRVRVYRFGATEGTPVVLLHGRTGTSTMWQPNIAALAERYPVYAVDLLGEPGCSVQSVSIRHGDDQAAWLTHMLAALDLDAVHLVGASFGGWLAMNQAIRAPERVASVSVLDPPRTFAPLSFRMMAASLGAFPIAPEKFRKWFMTWISGGEEVSMDDPVARLIAASMRCFRVALPLPEYPTDQQLRTVTVPVLALISGKSTVHAPPEGVRSRQPPAPPWTRRVVVERHPRNLRRMAGRRQQHGSRVPRPHDRSGEGVMAGETGSTSAAKAMGRGEMTGAVLDVLVPVVAYYVLRAAGWSEWTALLAGAVVPAARAGYALIRRHTVNWIPVGVLGFIVVSVAVSFLSGSPRFLLAKDGIIVAAAGVAILVTLVAKQPVMYKFSRAFVGMAGYSADDWDAQWESSAHFRRIWRVVTLIWGVGVLVGAVTKVTIAYTLPIDVVPAVALALWAALIVGLNVVTQIYLRLPSNKDLVFT